jgi:hypothetical protein
MKLLSVKLSRSIWFVNLNELNPRGLSLLPLVQSLITKYNFQLFPNKPDELFGKEINELKFIGGSFQKDTQHTINVDLIIFNWGLVAETRSSTHDSDAFLDDLLNWASTEIELVTYKEVIRSKVYLSELWVQIDKSLNSLNHKLNNFAKRLTSLVEGHGHHSFAFETSGIVFGTDYTVVGPPGAFRFERMVDVPFIENRYYSVAPLQTDLHLEMLEELEGILSS